MEIRAIASKTYNNAHIDSVKLCVVLSHNHVRLTREPFFYRFILYCNAYGCACVTPYIFECITASFRVCMSVCLDYIYYFFLRSFQFNYVFMASLKPTQL